MEYLTISQWRFATTEQRDAWLAEGRTVSPADAALMEKERAEYLARANAFNRAIRNSGCHSQ